MLVIVQSGTTGQGWKTQEQICQRVPGKRLIQEVQEATRLHVPEAVLLKRTKISSQLEQVVPSSPGQLVRDLE